jgi:iron uptake system EfeUOB component EfeO/EfeM
MSNIKEIFEKYKEAENINPAFERVELFSWNDMLALKSEIESLQEKLNHVTAVLQSRSNEQ